MKLNTIIKLDNNNNMTVFSSSIITKFNFIIFNILLVNSNSN